MIQHYFKIAFRNILKYKAQSIISILGLAVGFTCFALATLWIHYEMTYDDFHEGADRIYFVGRKNLVENENTIFASSRLPYAVHKQLKLDFSGNRIIMRMGLWQNANRQYSSSGCLPCPYRLFLHKNV